MVYAIIVFAGLLLGITVLSYGFTDPNLTLSAHPFFRAIHDPLFHLVYYQRSVTTVLFASALVILFACYLYLLRHKPKFAVIIVSAVILVFSYPALTYDLFNYIATAKVAFAYHENPYIVMPIEIPNDPNLAFTRAANKVALYGPVWILLTAIPHYAGGGNVWATVIAFKFMNALAYLGFAYFIYRVTKNLTNVVFFALNPLVLFEVLMNGHNDMYMMIPALGGLLLWRRKNMFIGCLLFIASWFVKGATVILAPLLFLKNISWERMLLIAYCLLSFVFFVMAPIREELYPWYAVWLVMTASLLPLASHRYLWGFTIVLTFALELRNLPYMWMGYYEGPGPILRTLVTVIPVAAYCIYFLLFRRKFHKT